MPTEKIVLLNFDEECATRLSAFFQLERYKVTVVIRRESFSQILRIHRKQFDLAVLDVSHRENYVWAILTEINLYRAANGSRPAILCVSRLYRGPQFALDVERKGARLIYV